MKIPVGYAESDPMTSAQKNTGAARVLVVDDEDRFRESMLKILKAKGLDAVAVSGGAEALAALEESDFDVVLLDVKMPGVDGIEVLQRMQGRQHRAEVLILTGHASLDTAMAIVRHGAYDYLLKPCDIDELIIKIDQAYERRLARNE
jgi:DNA-binding NtrC family response regulator